MRAGPHRLSPRVLPWNMQRAQSGASAYFIYSRECVLFCDSIHFERGHLSRHTVHFGSHLGTCKWPGDLYFYGQVCHTHTRWRPTAEMPHFGSRSNTPSLIKDWIQISDRLVILGVIMPALESFLAKNQTHPYFFFFFYHSSTLFWQYICIWGFWKRYSIELALNLILLAQAPRDTHYFLLGLQPLPTH